MDSLTIEAPDGGFASLATLPTAAYRTDADGFILGYNEPAALLWGRRPEPGERWCGSHKIYHMNGTSMPHAECPMARSLKTGIAVNDAQALCETPDGRLNAFRPQPVLLRTKDGKLTGGINLLFDVTEGWQALSALSEREAWLSGVFESDVVGLKVFDYRNLRTIQGE